MARKRDYKREYAQRKAKAKRLGYGSLREYRKARKIIQPARNQEIGRRRVMAKIHPDIIPKFKPGLKGIAHRRRENQIWSDRHSRKDFSEYDPDFDDKQSEDYWRTFVDDMRDVPKRLREAERTRRIYDYYADYTQDIDIPEWSETWKSP